MQLGLDTQYPALGPIQLGLAHQIVGVHPRTPDIPDPLLRTRWAPSPCDRLSRPRTTTDPPPRSGALNRQRACPPPPWRDGGEGDPRMVPTFTITPVGGIGAQLCPCSLAADTPQAFSVSSPPTTQSGFGVDAPHRAACAAARPTSTSLEPVPS